jgi:outer membrane protein assembly factor BamB
MRNKVKPLTFILVILSNIIILTGCGGWPIPSKTHSPQSMLGLSEIWSLTSVYARQDSFTPMMVANQGKVLVLGGLANNAAENIVCLDGMNGDLRWQKGDWSSTASALFAALDGLYVGYSGLPQVKKYNYATGEILWSQSLKGRGLGYIYVLVGEVQVSTDPFLHSVLNEATGKIINSVQYLQGAQDIFISTPVDTIIRPLRVIKTSTGELIWQQNLDRELTLAPIFLDDMILIRTNRTKGSIYALDRASGAVLWQTDGNIVSSIAYSTSNAKVYALTRDGQLLSIDRDSGKQVIIAEFSSAPFIVNGEQVVGGYEIAFDDSTQMLYVLLGDSRQLFAFQVR